MTEGLLLMCRRDKSKVLPWQRTPCLCFVALLISGATSFWLVLEDADGTLIQHSDVGVVGHLATRDRAEILHLIRHEIRTRQAGLNWSRILLSLYPLRRLHEGLHDSERISDMELNPDGTVSVGAGRSARICGYDYELKKDGRGWQITGRRVWATTGLDFDVGAN